MSRLHVFSQCCTLQLSDYRADLFHSPPLPPPPQGANDRTPIPSSRRSTFLRGLAARADTVLATLQSVLAGGAAAGHTGWVTRVFKCFGAWVSCVDLPAAGVAASPLFSSVFEALLRYPRLFNTACDTVGDLVHAFKRPETDWPVISRLLPHLLSLAPMWDAALAADDEDALLSLARMFSDAAVAYIRVAVVTDDPVRSGAAVPLVALVMRVAVCPLPDVSAASFRFWKALEEELYTLRE